MELMLPRVRDFNPRSPCGERHLPRRAGKQTRQISIHAPRAGSDLFCRPRLHRVIKFQSTLPVRGATSPPVTSCPVMMYFNPRSPCGERQIICTLRNENDYYFNPRSPCGERLVLSPASISFMVFQSTLPVRGATHLPIRRAVSVLYFNPRSPCGERRRDNTIRPQQI